MAKSQWIEPQLRALHDAVTAGEDLKPLASRLGKSLETLMHFTALRGARFSHLLAERARRPTTHSFTVTGRVESGPIELFYSDFGDARAPRPNWWPWFPPRFEDLQHLVKDR